MKVSFSAWKLFAALAVACVMAAPAVADQPCNKPPSAKITPTSQAVNENTAVQLNGDASAGNTAFLWQQLSGTAVVPDGGWTDSKLRFTSPWVLPAGETLTFRLTVSGCPGGTSSTDATVTVRNVNNPPTAAITTSPATVYEGNLVTLSGADSTDPDGNMLTYAWHQATGSAATLSGASDVAATFTAPSVGKAGESLTFVLRVTDPDGLWDEDTVIVNVLNLNQPPTLGLSCPSDVDEGDPVTLVGTATDDSVVATYSWSQSGAPGVTSADWYAPTLAFDAPALTSGQTGPLTFELTVTDDEGLATKSSCVVKVNDVTAPVLTLPADITEEATGPTGAVVSFTPSALDAVDGTVTVTCAPDSGATFALGATTVNCTAADKAGNEGSGSFTVTVQDTTPPVLTVPANITAEATGATGAAVTFTATATDLVDTAPTVTCTPASGDTFALGTTTVNCTAKDASENSSTGSFTVTVVDTTPPALTLPANINAVATGPTGAAVTFTATASDLVDGSVAVTCTPASGSTFGFGSTTVTCSATDKAGNTASGTFTVSVTFAAAGLCLAGPGHQILQPIALTGASVFPKKAGSTVPTKFRVCDASGNSLGAVYPVVSYQLVRTINGTAQTEVSDDVISTSADSLFRWSAADQFWIFNLSTKPYIGGQTYVFQINLIDGTNIQFQFGLK